MSDLFVVDDFFTNVDSIREFALKLNYKKSNSNTGWKGFRTELTDLDTISYINKNINSINPIFQNLKLECFFHYSTEETKNNIKNFDKQRLHRDISDWAGVIYLTPNPKLNSGTSIHNDDGSIRIIDNVYNRFIFYDSKLLHGAMDTFGKSIEDSRLTITVFGSNVKSKKTLL